MTEHEPVVLQEDARTGDRFLVYSTSKGLQVALRYDGDALWLTQAQIAELFGVDRTVVTRHIANIFAEGELDPGSTSAKIAQVRQEGSRTVERQVEHYTLDAVISVGYRVSSAQATLFSRSLRIRPPRSFRRERTRQSRTWAYAHGPMTTSARTMLTSRRTISAIPRSGN